MTINGTFRFHAVGQGLFYSGLIQGTGYRYGETFSFVYDCGSISSRCFLHREIDDFKALLPYTQLRSKKRLDLLIVSHMHDDHVNGLEYLLYNVEVDTVVMPYTDSVIRLLARAESSSEEEFLSAFYMDPIGWFASNGAHRILLIGSPPDGDYRNQESNDYISRYNGEADRIHVERSCILASDSIGETELLFLDNIAQAEISLYWRFRFSNLKLSVTKNYIDTVDRFQREKMLSLDDIFHDRLMTKELAKRLRSVIPSEKTINRTSVVVEHEPRLEQGKITCFQSPLPIWIGSSMHSKYLKDILYPLRKIFDHCRRTVLTGDIEIKEDESIPLSDKLEYTVFQYPHHGARKALPYTTSLHRAVVVFSAGVVNKYGHPHPDVLNNEEYSILVTERNAFDYSIAVIE